MSDDIRPTWSDGLPLCDESCPQHDGKRCRAMGFRPDRFCEPALLDLRARLAAAERELERWRHGETIEGDSVCPNELQAVNAEQDLARLRTLGDKVNAIRNSIVGAQKVNWSEHVYPLVAALDEAGFAGQPYPEARENVGTLLERLAAAEQRAREAEAERDEARREKAETITALVTADRDRNRLRNELECQEVQFDAVVDKIVEAEAARDAAIARATAAEGREAALRTALGEAADKAARRETVWLDDIDRWRALAAQAPTDATDGGE